MIRLQKYIAEAGVCSRRKAEELIQAGQVKVNGQITRTLGTKIDPATDQVEVMDRLIRHQPLVYVMLNKPKGVVTTRRDPQGRPTVLDFVPSEVRLFPVGRLDYDTEGLLLLTNDGELAHRLTHPSYEIKKTYVAQMRGEVSSTAIRQLQRGVRLDDGMTWPAQVSILEISPNKTEVSLTIHEGRNRQVRRMGEAVGHPVLSLRRIGFGDLHLGSLKVGKYRSLNEKEVANLYRAVRL